MQEQDLPPAAAARLYQARLRAAQGELESLQAAVKARDARLGGLEKEVQALRQVLLAERERCAGIVCRACLALQLSTVGPGP